MNPLNSIRETTMKTFKSLGRELAREHTYRKAMRRSKEWGDFDDMGNERIERAYHAQRMAKRGLLFC